MNSKNINIKYKIHKLLIALLCVSTILMGIGYAASTMLLEVDGNAVAVVSNTIEITNVVLSSSNNANTANSSINSYFNTNLNSTVELNNDSASSITYAVTVYNNLGTAKAYKDTTPPYTNQTNFYDNTGIKYEVTGITKGEVLQNHASKTFYVTFSYANGVSSNKVLNSVLAFNFDDYYTITYSNITGFTSETIIAGDNLVVNFGNNAPNNVTVVGAATYVAGTDYTYSNGTLTINGVSENITVTGVNQGPTGTWNDPYIDTTTNTYNPDPTNATVGTTRYDGITGKPKVTVETINNQKYVTAFEYTDLGNGLTLTSSVDTGIMLFKGRGFRIEAEFDYNTTGNGGKYLLAALVQTGTQGNNKLYSGFALYEYKTSQIYLSATETGAKFGNTWGSQLKTTTVSTGNKHYIIDFYYDNQLLTGTFEPNSSNNVESYNVSSTHFPTDLDNATITIGGNGVSGYDVSGMVLTKFKVTRYSRT